MGNCLMTAPGYGQLRVSVNRVQHGVNIIPNGEGQTRNGRVFYTKQTTSDSFSLSVQFRSYENYVRFLDWMEDYSRKISHPNNYTVGPLRVEVPSVRFDRKGIPISPMMRGDAVGNFVYRLNMTFEGTVNLVDTTGRSPISRFVNPELSDSVNYLMSPSQLQLKAGESAEDRLYGTNQAEMREIEDRLGLPPGQMSRML